MIQVSHLTKRYGEFVAVDDLSFEIESGHIYGFLGPNGAGKSTTMNILTGCLSATEGTVTIDGHDIVEEPREAKRRIGYLPEIPPLYRNETPVEYLQFVGAAKGLRGPALRAQITSVLAQTHLQEVSHRRTEELSKGYRQRLGIAQALLGDPSTIILDEPTVGLDPLQIVEIRDLIRQLGETHTVILSSHILSEIQNLCDQILIISRGTLLAFDTPSHLEQRLRSASSVRLLAEADLPCVRDLLLALPEVSSYEIIRQGDGFTGVDVHTGHDDIHDLSRALYQAFAREGIVLLELRVQRADLETVFLELTERAAEDAPETPEIPDVPLTEEPIGAEDPSADGEEADE